MLKLLLASSALATVLVLTQPARSAVIADLGVNPTSAQGDFNNSVGGGAFEDQFTFQLVGGPLFFTIASATNVYPNPTDFITGFTASIWSTGDDGIVNNGDDVLAFGPQLAAPCPGTPNCQGVSGSGLINPGAYYLEFTGFGGGTSGYGGNLSTFAVPNPVLGGGLPGLLMAIGGFVGWRRWRT